jgi:hypothetical protein
MLATLEVIRRASQAGPLGTVVVVGAGVGADVDSILAQEPARLIAVEADPRAAAALRRRYAGRPSVEVRGEALSVQGGAQEWFQCNLRRLDGLLRPGANLREAYPRLVVTGGSIVQTEPMGPWLARLGLHSSEEAGNNLLVLDVAGAEGALLESLDAPLLDAFAWVIVRGAVRALHEGGSTLAETRDRMLALGYRVAGGDAGEALWPVELYHGDPRARRLARVREQLDRVEADLEKRTAQLAEARQALAEAGERERTLLLELEQAKAQAASIQDEQDRAEESHRQQLAGLNARLEQATHELTDARAVTAQSVKLLNLREADLSELRNRYGALQSDNRFARDLLSELGRRLGQTHESFAQLVARRDGTDR